MLFSHDNISILFSLSLSLTHTYITYTLTHSLGEGYRVGWAVTTATNTWYHLFVTLVDIIVNLGTIFWSHKHTYIPTHRGRSIYYGLQTCFWINRTFNLSHFLCLISMNRISQMHIRKITFINNLLSLSVLYHCRLNIEMIFLFFRTPPSWVTRPGRTASPSSTLRSSLAWARYLLLLV